MPTLARRASGALATLGLLGALAAPAQAQTGMTTQNPPAPNSSSGTVQPPNSLPRGAGVTTPPMPGSNLGTTRTQPSAVGPVAENGTTPAPRHHRRRHHRRHRAHTAAPAPAGSTAQ